MSDLEKYRAGEQEKARTADLLRILPRGRQSILDIGARDGYFSQLLTEYFSEVTALDLEKPSFEFPNVTTVAGNVTSLEFQDESFDCVFCAEVLEHVPDVQGACREILRVARHEIVIGVPFQQDTRIGRCTCNSCGKPNPPWGHVNSFTESRLKSLFSGAPVRSRSFVGETREATNSLSTFLMDLARNPWGSYDQDEPCIHCGAVLRPPVGRTSLERVCSAVATRLNRCQAIFVQPHGNWIHMVFSKTG